MFGVEPICAVLTEHGCKIAPSTYYDVRSRLPSRRALRDAEIIELIAAARDHKFRHRFGARKMWLHLRTQGHDVARCTVERLMAAQGWTGALRGKKPRTTVASEHDQRPADLVDRDFTATRPNQLWVADFTYVATFAGVVYVAFVFDVFSRRVVGWRAATRMTTDLVLDTLEMAIWTRGRGGTADLSEPLDPLTPPPSLAYVVSGTVVDDLGNPISGALVQLVMDRGTWTRATSTDARGFFAFEGVVGDVVLRVTPHPCGSSRALP